MSTPEEISIRLFRPDADVPPLVALLAAIAAGDKTGATVDEATVRSQLAWLDHDPARDRWGAEAPGEGSRFIGHAWVFAQSPQRSILYAAIDPAWRRQGIGSALLARAIARANEMGASQIVSAARAGRAAADAFLRRHGFLPAGHARTLTAPAALPIPEPIWPAAYMRCAPWQKSATSTCGPRRATAATAICEGIGRTPSLPPPNITPNSCGCTRTSSTRPASSSCLRRTGHRPASARAAWKAGGAGAAGIKVIAPASFRIDSPGVARSHRQLGLQRPLVLAALRWLSDRGAEDYRLETWGDSEEAVAIYRDLGFVVEDDTVEYLQKPKEV